MSGSPLRIDKEGRWFFYEEEITHRRTYLLFCQNLTRDEAGQIILRIGQEECPVVVEDVPFVVKTLEFVPSDGRDLKAIWLTLNDETRERLAPETLRIGPENIPYCRVRSGQFEARFSRGAYQLLALYIHHDEKGTRFFLTVGGRRYHLS